MVKYPTALLVLFVLASVNGAVSQPPRIEFPYSVVDSTGFTFVETNHGILQSGGHVIINNQNSPGGTHKLSNSYVFTKKTDTIPAILHVSFGSEFFLKSSKDTVINLRMVWRFPEEIVNRQNKAYEESSFDFPCYTNQLSFSSYDFDEYYEVKPGTWQLLIYHNNELIYSHYFYLVLHI